MAFDYTPHLKVSGIAATPEWIGKRERAIKQLAVAFRKKGTDDALALAAVVVAQIARGFHGMPDAIRTEVFNAVRKPSPQWVPDKHADAELGLCAILAAVLAMSEASSSDFPGLTPFATSLLSGAQFVPKGHTAQLETLRREIVQVFGDALHARAETVRHRSFAGGGAIPTAKPEEAVNTHLGRVISSIQGSLNGLQANAKLDREELDLLWWRLNGVGTIIPGRFAQHGSARAAVCAGIEVGTILTQFVASDAHRAIAISVVPDPTDTLDLLETIAAVGDRLDRVKSAYAAGAAKISQFPTIFPLLYGLQVGGADNTVATLVAARIDAKAKRSAETWCARAVDETALLKRIGIATKIPPAERV